MDECENVIEFEQFEALCDAACDNMVKIFIIRNYIFNCSVNFY